MNRIVAVKSDSGEWILDVLGNPWGGPANGRDSDGEYFDSRTKFHEDKFGLPPAVYYHGYSPEGKPEGEPRYIGKTVNREVRADGVWYRVVLDKASEYAQRVWEAAKNGIARASSGSNHLHRTDQDGHIREWPVTELSIFDVAGNRQPANAYAVALPAMKAVYAAAGIALPLDIEPEPEAEPISEPAGEQNGNAEPEPEQDSTPVREGMKMSEEKDIKAQIAEAVQAAMQEEAAKRQADAEAKAAEEARTAEAVKAALEAQKAEFAKGNRLPLDGDGAPYVTKFGNTSKYDNLDDGDLAFMTDVLKSANKIAPENALKALAVRVAESDKDEHQEIRGAMKMAGMPLKANDLNYSTLANYGDEWVGVSYSSQLWRKISQESPVISRLPTVEVPQGAESIVIPVESTAPTFYKVAQATAQAANPGAITRTVTTSRLGTDNVTLTVGKLGASTYFTGEMVEDSVIPWISELRASMMQEAMEVLEHVVIDGDTDTTATTNINDIGGTPVGTEAFLLFDGFRKSCLITTTTNSRDCGALTAPDYLETLKLMGLGGRNVLARDRSAVAFIQDVWTGWKALELAEGKTRDVYSQPTIENGQLISIWGRDVITTANMHRANTDATYGLKAQIDGLVDLNTAADNIAGAILAVRFDQWRLGWKRRITVETRREPSADATEIVALMRVGLIQRDTEASAISYNVTL